LDEGFDIAQLLKLRKLTRVIADHLTRELRAHLTTLAPLLNPRHLFGEYIGGGRRLAGKTAEQSLEELRNLYERVHHTKPFNLRSRFDTPITLLSAGLEIQPSTSSYTAKDGDEEKRIIITTPLKWILSFEGFGPSRLNELLAATGDNVGSKLQESVLHYLLLHITLEKRTGVRNLLQALRYKVSTEQLPEYGNLPLVILSAPLNTVRPPDRVMIESTEISGTRQFEEVVDPEALTNIEDPVKKKLSSLIVD
jgi:hypothetical protein